MGKYGPQFCELKKEELRVSDNERDKQTRLRGPPASDDELAVPLNPGSS